jgi:hypothetical protein
MGWLEASALFASLRETNCSMLKQTRGLLGQSTALRFAQSPNGNYTRYS